MPTGTEIDHDAVRRAILEAALAHVPFDGWSQPSLNAGARDELAQNVDVLLFLHADTVLPPEADRAIFRAVSNLPRCWGRFDVTIEGTDPWLPWIARLMNWRSRLTGIATGDQAIFVLRRRFASTCSRPLPL